MKRKLLMAFLLLPLTAFSGSVNVNVAIEGTLEKVLSEQSVTDITDLTITGRLTAADIIYLRSGKGCVANLEKLDLKGVTLVASEEPFLEGKYHSYYLSDNERVESVLVDPSSWTLDDEYYHYNHYDLSLAGAFKGMFLEKIVLPTSVKKIGYECFRGCKFLEQVDIPSGLTAVDDYAFTEAISLSTIDLSGVSTIGEYAFSGCSSLENVDLKSVKQMGQSAFANCLILAGSINLQQLSVVPEQAFYGCAKIGKILFSSSLSDIGKEAFKGCTGIVGTVSLPNGLETIGESAFENCQFPDVIFPSTLKTISKGAFSMCSNLTAVTLPLGLETIGDHAFFGSTNITSITFPASLKYIGVGCFGNLQSITFTKGSGGLVIGNYAFESSYNLESITFAEGLESIGIGAFSDCHRLKTINLPEGLKTIGSFAFRNCWNIASVTIPGTLQEMGQDVFASTAWADTQKADDDGILYYGTIAIGFTKEIAEGTVIKIKEGTLGISDNFAYSQKGVTNVEFPSTLKTIGAGAFKGTGISEVDFPSSLVSIGYEAFGECTLIKKITIPEAVEKIYSAFHSCSSLAQVTLNARHLDYGTMGYLKNLAKLTICSNVEVLPANFAVYENIAGLSTTPLKVIFQERAEDSDLFIGKDALPYSCISSLTLPNCRIALDDNAFGGDSYHPKSMVLKIPGVITKLGKEALQYCTGLTGSIRLSNDVTTIGSSCFSNTGITSIEIPKSVKSIESLAFSNCDNLTSVVIPGNVKNIDRRAFLGCNGIAKVIIENGVENIGNEAFSYCDKLELLTISGSVKTIDEKVFCGCKSLVSLKINNGVENIGISAFEGCSGIVSLEIPSSVKKIGERAFHDCRGMTTLILGDGVEKIESQSFSLCEKLESLNIPHSVKSIGSYAFYGCRNLKTILLPKNLTIIEEATFRECKALESIVIPNGVETIEKDAFMYCDALSSIDLPESINNIESAFYKTYPSRVIIRRKDPPAISYVFRTSSATLYVPVGCKEVYSQADVWKDFMAIVEIDSEGDEEDPNIIKFADSKTKEICLKYWDTDEDGKLSKTEAAAVLWIGNAFVESEITSFNEFSYFTAVTDIDDAAFRKCKNLQEITLPNSATSIGKQTFAYCQNLTKVVMSNSMSSIGDYAFMGCSSLASIDFTDNLTKIGVGAFENCSALSTISIPASVFYIGGSPFDTCSGLTSINVDNDNMRYCSVDGVLFDKACTKIVQYPIGKKGSEYAIPATVTTIGEGAFISSANLHGIIIPEGVMTIELGAFMDCTGLESITIPQCVESLAKYCFYGCSSLKSVTSMIVNPFEIESNVFETGNGIFTTATLYTPMGSASNYQSTGGWKNFKKFMPIGDVNGDSAINDTDVKEEAGYILDKPSKTFVKAAADMNGDGVINVADIVLMNAINSKK